MPKAIFHLGLNANEIAILAFLMYCEDRKTYQCHPSYSTIGSACGMSNNTVKKYVDSLVRKGFLCTEPTKVKTRDGRSHNGSLCYIILPIQPLEEDYYEEQLRIAENHALLSKAMKKYGGIVIPFLCQIVFHNFSFFAPLKVKTFRGFFVFLSCLI